MNFEIDRMTQHPVDSAPKILTHDKKIYSTFLLIQAQKNFC